MISTIEMLGMRLNARHTLTILQDSWSQIRLEHLTPRIRPFVSAIGYNSLLIYGGEIADGNLISGGVVIDMSSNLSQGIENDFSILS